MTSDSDFNSEMARERDMEAERKLSAFDVWKDEHKEELKEAFEIETGNDPVEYEDDFWEFCEEKYKEE